MSDRIADVITLRTGYDPEGDEAVVTRFRHPYDADACTHPAVGIDNDNHRLLCRRCDAEVDPLDWIKHLAKDWSNYQWRLEQAKERAKQAEEASDRRVKEAQRVARTPSMPMALGKRLARISRTVGRAHVELAEASGYLAEVHDAGRLSGMADHHLRGAARQIELARASLAKLERDHGRPARLPG